MALCGAEICTLRKTDQNYPERFEMLRWRKMEKVIWTGSVKTHSKGGEKYPTYSTQGEGYLDWSHLA
jgi:hypothetical protein